MPHSPQSSTVALILFHELGARLGIITGQGLAGLIRERYGVRWATVALVALVIANVGTTGAEFAGVAAALGLAGVSRYVSVPLAALLVSVLVLRGRFHRVEHVLLILATAFATYIAAGLLSHPDWSAAAHGLFVPSMPLDRDGLLLVTATIGTTLAPWGLSFIQSYAVDKRLTSADLRYERNSARGCWAPPCWPPRSSRSPPRTRSARRSGTRPDSTTPSARRARSTSPMASWSRSLPVSS